MEYRFQTGGIHMRQKNQHLSLMDWVAVCMAVLLIVGRAIPIQPLNRFFLFSVTLDRLAFDILTVVLLVRRFIRRKSAIRFSREFLLFLGMMVFWIIYGIAAGSLSSYSSLLETERETILLLRGIMVVYCMFEVLETRNRTDLFISGLRLACIVLIIMAVWEALSGRYIWTSKYDAMPTVTLDGQNWMTGLYKSALYVSTGVFYNENDLSTILSLLFPLFFLTKNVQKGKAVLYGTVLCMGTFVLMLNDSNINAMALLVSLLAYTILVRGNWERKTGMLGGISLLYIRAADWIGMFVLKLKGVLFHGISAEELLERAGLEDPVKKTSVIPSGKSFFDNFRKGLGSMLESGNGPLMSRVKIYKDGLKAFLASHGLGYGPGSYKAYFSENPGQTSILDPHNWWLEIMVKYGILVFAAYLATILTLYVRMIRTYLKNCDELYAVTVAICTGFVIACISPSSFIRAVYQWFIPGLCIVLLRQNNDISNS